MLKRFRSESTVFCTSTPSLPLGTSILLSGNRLFHQDSFRSLELVVWLVPSFLSGAISVSFVGLLLGPIYPIIMNHAGKVLPPWLLTGSIGWIAGFGQAGSAIIPFITGALASSKGIQSLQPLCVFLLLHPSSRTQWIDWNALYY